MSKADKTVVVDKVELRIGNKTISLTLEQLRELREALDELFPKEVVKTVPVPSPYPYPVPSPYPVVPWVEPWKYRQWEPTWIVNNQNQLDDGHRTLVLTTRCDNRSA